MKSVVYGCIMVGLLGVAPLCQAETENNPPSFEQVKKETRDLLHTIASYSAEKKNEAVQSAKEGLDRLDRRIDSLQAWIDEHWSQMSEATRQQARETLDTLRRQRVEAAEWYGRMKASSADAWEQVKQGFSKSYKALADTWEKSKQSFSTEPQSHET